MSRLFMFLLVYNVRVELLRVGVAGVVGVVVVVVLLHLNCIQLAVDVLAYVVTQI